MWLIFQRTIAGYGSAVVGIEWLETRISCDVPNLCTPRTRGCILETGAKMRLGFVWGGSMFQAGTLG